MRSSPIDAKPSKAKLGRGLVVTFVSLAVVVALTTTLRLPPSFGLIAFGLQWGFFLLQGWPQRSEKLYDASGSLTHLSIILAGLLHDPVRSPRQILLSIFAVVWCTRLGTFLFNRISQDSKDSRFTELKEEFWSFSIAWNLQVLWVFLLELPVMLVNTSPQPPTGLWDVLGWSLWCSGFLLEAVADGQKFAFRGDPSNRGRFITTGLWRYSRHPNYFGEILMWIGLCMSFTSCVSSTAQLLAWISPAFNALLLIYVSGVPLLEKVLIPTWFGFAIAGMIMFGRRMQVFSTPLSGFAMCLQLALEGEYDWGYMSSEDWFITLLWVWIYMVLLVMVMLNMVLAIIMDVYAEVRRQQGETMSIFQHCTYLFKRALYFKNWVPDRELWERVAEMPETIIVDDILEAYPNMPDFQLSFLCDGARNRTRVIQRAGIDPTYTVQMVAAIHISLEEIMMDLMKLKKRGWMGKGFEVPSDEDRNLVKEILAGIAVQSEWMLNAQKHVSWLHNQIGTEATDGAGYEWKATGPVEVPVPRSRQGND